MAVSDTQCRLTLESHQQIYQAPLLDTSAVAYFILLSLRLVAACNVQRGVEGPRQSHAFVPVDQHVALHRGQYGIV